MLKAHNVSPTKPSTPAADTEGNETSKGSTAKKRGARAAATETPTKKRARATPKSKAKVKKEEEDDTEEDTKASPPATPKDSRAAKKAVPVKNEEAEDSALSGKFSLVHPIHLLSLVLIVMPNRCSSD